MSREEDQAVISEALEVPDVPVAYVMDRLDKLGLVLHELRGGDRRSGPRSIAFKRYDGRVFRAVENSFERRFSGLLPTQCARFLEATPWVLP